MDIFSFITLFGGLAFFLYGMNVMSQGLEKVAGGKIEGILKKMTSNPVKSMALGAGITIAIQSSSALTVMLVGLVNSGIMEVADTFHVIIGSTIGTTITSWILSLAGISSDNVFIRLLKPESFSPIFALVGIILIMVAKSVKKRDVGKILIGFSILMFGMQLMSSSVSPLKDSPQFTSILTAFQNPLLGVLVGTLFTGVIQSSAASVGILQALSLTGQITYGMAIPIIMGENIGTCVTALLSSIGVRRDAKRVAVMHISMAIIGTIVCLIGFYAVDFVVDFAFVDKSIGPVHIAFIHTAFNIVKALILMPFKKQIVALSGIIVRGSDKDKTDFELLDERLLTSPPVAIARCHQVTLEMATLCNETFKKAMQIVFKYDSKVAEQLISDEAKTDEYEDALGSYLVKITRQSLSVDDSHKVSNLLLTIGDIERIADHAIGIVKVAEEMNSKKIFFSPKAKEEISTLFAAITEILDMTIEAFENNDLELAKKIEPLEQVVDKLVRKFKNHHVERIGNNECNIELGFVFNDLLTNCSRTADHCSNIAVCLIQVADDSFDTHEYLNNMKSNENNSFRELYASYKKKYNA